MSTGEVTFEGARQLRELLDRMERLAEPACVVQGEALFGVRRDLCRAFIVALHTGAEPVRAIATANFGVRSLEELGEGGRRLCRAQAARLASFGLAIPRRALRGAA